MNLEQIRFRGKRVNNGEWVEGCLLKDFDYNGKEIYLIRTINALGRIYDSRVKPETVGMFTGMQDKNGVYLFSGDIVSCVRQLRDDIINVHVGIITWDKLHCHFYFHSVKNEISRTFDNDATMEKLGSKFDNQELL